MLPEGWKEKIFGDIVRNTQLGTTKRGADINLDHNLNLVKMGNLLWGSLDLSNVEKLSSTQLDGDYLLKKGDFLFNTRNTPELVGKSAAWKENSGSYCYDNNINRIIFSNDADPFYMEYYLNFGSGKKSVRALASGSTSVAAIYWKGLKNLRIILPPLPEQKKIAAILSTWDRAIEGTETLLANSQQQKKALMQQLLTGKNRLPGFTGEWKHTSLKSCCACLDNKRVPLNSDERQEMSGDIPYWGANGVVDHINKYIFNETIVLIAEDGGYFSEYRDRPIAQISYGKSWVNNHAHILRAKSDICIDEWVYYCLVHKDITAFVNGGTRAKLNKEHMLQIRIPLPDINEQQELVSVLTTADEEITTLESDLARLRQEKKALMQQLLTGKRRVTVD